MTESVERPTSDSIASLPGRLVVLSGPSGVGKTVICDVLIERAGCTRVITATSRAPRDGEQDGVDYYFRDRAGFESDIRSGRFLEHAEVHGNLYGTPLDPVREQLSRGETALLNIDVQGAVALIEHGIPACYVFIAPPSLEELEARLRKRSSDKDEQIRVRLANAREELAQQHHYDHVIVNDNLDRAVQEMIQLLARE